MKTSRTEPAAFRLVAQHLNQLLHHVPPSLTITADVSVSIVNRLVFMTDAERLYSKVQYELKCYRLFR